MSFNMISFDGGGIRGLISAVIIKKLDEKYHILNKTNAFIGTSTGGILAIALANEIPISKIIESYTDNASIIFMPNNKFSAEGLIPENILSLFHSKYTHVGMKKIFNRFFGEKKLSESKKIIIVNTAQLLNTTKQGWEPVILSNCVDNIYKNIKMIDAALATAAAPTYFPPYRIDENNLGYCVDGGVFANNPTTIAISEIISQQLVSSLSELCVLSIGTGYKATGIPLIEMSNPLNVGANFWLLPHIHKGQKNIAPFSILQLILDTSSEIVTKQGYQLLKDNFKRVNPTLSKDIQLDDWHSINLILTETDNYLLSQEWEEVCNWVQDRWK
ncbi:patatin-like phospholipase family protein [Providencia sp. PROV152]|uniref:Patatin-like phospholipase family protein n=1 Tax=Providencia stuartii TaxID=588 RepID=A0AAI9HZD5_PROST|nr:patatin-like phospholipase family protein [Providencia sp. PROV152]ELR5035384.1 patatin-like phospholipase family protein [Providencia stuartii]